jgi:hypothetical protein
MWPKTTVRYHLPPAECLLSKRWKIATVGGNVEKKESMYTVGGNWSWYTHGKLNEGSLKN